MYEAASIWVLTSCAVSTAWRNLLPCASILQSCHLGHLTKTPANAAASETHMPAVAYWVCAGLPCRLNSLALAGFPQQLAQCAATVMAVSAWPCLPYLLQLMGPVRAPLRRLHSYIYLQVLVVAKLPQALWPGCSADGFCIRRLPSSHNCSAPVQASCAAQQPRATSPGHLRMWPSHCCAWPCQGPS